MMVGRIYPSMLPQMPYDPDDRPSGPPFEPFSTWDIFHLVGLTALGISLLFVIFQYIRFCFWIHEDLDATAKTVIDLESNDLEPTEIESSSEFEPNTSEETA